MRSHIELRSPSNGTGWRDTWTFTGPDATALRAALDALGDTHATDPEGDRWTAAIVLYPPEWGDAHTTPLAPEPPAERAWTAAAAPLLADLLPDRLAGLRADLVARFGDDA